MKTVIKARIRSEWLFLVDTSIDVNLIGSDLAEVTLDWDSDDARRVFDAHYKQMTFGDGMVVTWFEVRREFTDGEYNVASLYTLNVYRARPEYLDAEHTLYDNGSACSVCSFGKKQLSPLVSRFSAPRQSKLICLSSGFWLCKRDVALALWSLVHEDLMFLPVLSSRSDLRQWTEEHRTFDSYVSNYLKEDRLIENQKENVWFQLVPKRLCYNIVPPTEVGVYPFYPEKPHKDCAHLYGFRQMSGLVVSPCSGCNPMIGGTVNLVGKTAGLWLPRSALLFSRGVADVLIKFQSTDWAVEPAFIGDA